MKLMDPVRLCFSLSIGQLLLIGCLVTAQGVTAGSTNALLANVKQAQADVKAAQSALQALRDEIDNKRLPLRNAHRALVESVGAKRERLRSLETARRMEATARERLAEDVSRLEAEQRFILTALTEYRRGLETRVQTAELQALSESLTALDAALRGESPSLGEAVDVVLDAALVLGHRRGDGGYAFAGLALDDSGVEVSGTYRVMGPLAYFVSDAGQGSLVRLAPDSLLPTLVGGIKPIEAQAMAALVEGATSPAVPVDVSGGAAIDRERADAGWVEQVREGGFVMVPLLLTGLFSLVIAIWKFSALYRLRRSVEMPLDTVVDCVKLQDWQKAEREAARLRRPLSTLIHDALAHRHVAKEHLEEILHERMLSMTPGWESHLGTLAVFGAVAPLLGLLGTVTGMIHTFELVTLFGTGEARLLSGGISEALITTKFGLAIAIPVLVAHAFLVRRLRVITGRLEGTVATFANLLVNEGGK